MAEAIKVAVRVRPLSHEELSDGCASVVQVEKLEGTRTTEVKTPSQSFSFDFGYDSLDRSPSSSSREAPHEHSNELSLGGTLRTPDLHEAMFADIGQAIVRDAVNGYSSFLLAYGQTGSGKSSAIMGTGEQPGLAPRCIGEIVSRKASLEAEGAGELRVFVSYVEVLHNGICDLLGTSEQACDLEVIDHPVVGACVPNLTEAVCQTPADVQRLLDFGTKRRASRASQLGTASSRLHFVVSVKVECTQRSEQPLHSKVVFADLAGCEYHGQGARCRRLGSPPVEHALSVLTQALACLGKGSTRRCKRILRESALTTLLKDSLVGRARTYLMACVSPLEQDSEETLATLHFASLARSVKTTPRQGRDSSADVVAALHSEVGRLQAHMACHHDDSTVQGEFARLELLMQHTATKYDSRLESSRLLEEEHRAALMRKGLAHREVGEGVPCLLNMSNDPLAAGCLVYHLSRNQPTTIGSAESNSIPLCGLGIPQHLCKITNRNNRELTLAKISPLGRLSVNSKLLMEGEAAKLHHGDKVYVGRAFAMRVVLPTGDCSPEGIDLSLHGLEDEWSAVEESPSWGNLREYLDQVQTQMQPEQAHRLFEEMKRACQLCDEANELTSECRPEENLHFEVDLTSAVPSSVVVRVLQHEPMCDEEVEEQNCRVLYLWSLTVMEERLERMRAYHKATLHQERGSSALVDPLLDAWHEPHPEDVAYRLAELELLLAMEREANARITRRQRALVQRHLELQEATENAQLSRAAFGAWAACTRAGRKAKAAAGTALRPAAASRPSSPIKGSNKLDTSTRMRKPAASFDWSYRGGFKTGTPAARPSKAPTPVTPKPVSAAQTPRMQTPRSPSTGKKMMQATRGARTPAPSRPGSPGPGRPGAAERVERAQEAVAVEMSPPALQVEVEQSSFESTTDFRGEACEEGVEGEVVGVGVSRFISGIVTIRSEPEDVAQRVNVAGAAESTLQLKRQLEQAWQLGHVIRGQVPDQEQQESWVSGEAPRIHAPQVVDRPQTGLQSGLLAQTQRTVWNLPAPPWPPNGIGRPTADGHSSTHESLPSFPRCTVMYTTKAVVTSRSSTPFVHPS